MNGRTGMSRLGRGMPSRFAYSRYGGFSGFGDQPASPNMGSPSASPGGRVLESQGKPGGPMGAGDDPVWSEIEATFQDILGKYESMDFDPVIEPPDMSDPEDQMRYLQQLQAYGASAQPAATLMAQNVRSAMALIEAQGKQQKQVIDMLMKVAPLVADDKEMSAFLGANILNTMFPGKFDIQDKSTLGGWAGEEPGVSKLTPENALEGELFKGITAIAQDKANELARAGDKEGLKAYLDSVHMQLVAAKVDDSVAITIVNQIHADAVGARLAEEPVY